MAGVVDEAQTREYIKTLSGFLENGSRALESARRWPWKRGEVPRLLYEMAHNLVVRGVNECVIGLKGEARASFSRAITLATERFSALEQVFLGYHDVQVISAAVVANRPAEAEAAAVLALKVSQGTHSNPIVTGTNAGTRALLGWLNRAEDVVRLERGNVQAGGLKQFALWAEIAGCAIERDAQGFQDAFDKLVALVRKEVRSGEYRYSEDRFAYLPGQLVLSLAERDSIAVTVPKDDWWQACRLDNA